MPRTSCPTPPCLPMMPTLTVNTHLSKLAHYQPKIWQPRFTVCPIPRLLRRSPLTIPRDRSMRVHVIRDPDTRILPDSFLDLAYFAHLSPKPSPRTDNLPAKPHHEVVFTHPKHPDQAEADEQHTCKNDQFEDDDHVSSTFFSHSSNSFSH